MLPLNPQLCSLEGKGFAFCCFAPRSGLTIFPQWYIPSLVVQISTSEASLDPFVVRGSRPGKVRVYPWKSGAICIFWEEASSGNERLEAVLLLDPVFIDEFGQSRPQLSAPGRWLFPMPGWSALSMGTSQKEPEWEPRIQIRVLIAHILSRGDLPQLLTHGRELSGAPPEQPPYTVPGSGSSPPRKGACAIPLAAHTCQRGPDLPPLRKTCPRYLESSELNPSFYKWKRWGPVSGCGCFIEIQVSYSSEEEYTPVYFLNIKKK